MANVFISSRMSELETERLAAFHAYHRLGHRPLMFEMQPTDGGVKQTVIHMIDSADVFVGIFRDTIGPQSYDLEVLPPILYELARFVAGFCAPSRRAGACKATARSPDCLSAMHQYLRGRCLPSEVLPGCRAALEEAQRRLVMFAAEPLDERTVSTQLEALLALLRSAGVPVRYFANRFDLFTQIVTHPFQHPAKGSAAAEGELRYVVRYAGSDHPGQVHALATEAFGRGMNIEYLFVQTDRERKRTAITALVVPYAQPRSVARRPGELQHDPAGALCAALSARKSLFTKSGLSVEGEAQPPALPSVSPDFTGAAYLKVRIYHLNVPGIIARISHMLADRTTIFRFALNIERCVLLCLDPPSHLRHLLYGSDMQAFTGSDMQALTSPLRSMQSIQICDLVLTDAAANEGETLRSRGLAGVFQLENALSSIAGVDHVICSNWSDSEGRGQSLPQKGVRAHRQVQPVARAKRPRRKE